MLHLKRKVGQAVRIAGELLVTVKRIQSESPNLRGLATLHFESAVSISDVTVCVGDTVSIPAPFDRGNVVMRLAKIHRGEAFLDFDAPRSIAIDRAERRNETSL